MTSFKIGLACLLMFFFTTTFSQTIKKELSITRIKSTLKIDGVLDEAVWKQTPVADKFMMLRPVPNRPENIDNASQVYFLYDDEGLYVGGYFHEKNKDSIASELVGRDGFGNNDFAGIIFDTYNDKLNGFEYFVTPLGEQFDAKVSPNTNSNSEDFSWNAVWQSASKINADGWSFEMFIPYSAIRFGKKKVQDWGLNIVRRRQKSGEQSFWNPIEPTVNGFLTQEGMLKGLEDIKPPLRLQFTPYFSSYVNHDNLAEAGTNKTSTSINGGVDVKYGINQAFTLDMTLVPDFGQAQSDNRVLNLSPFEQRFNENRTFFTEGTELFSKGNLFYSRRIGRIGGRPLHYYDVNGQLGLNEREINNPNQVKLINATKISGRTQKGLGIGILNAITNSQNAIIENNDGQQRKYETEPLTNYNIFVLDQTMKNNSSVSFVNSSVIRSGKEYDANVSSVLFDLNNKKNTWKVGGSAGISALLGKGGKNEIGYNQSLYFGKTSGRLNFNFYHELSNAKYDKSDLGYFTNNNTMDQNFWMGYKWIKPGKFYNQMRLNFNSWYSRLVSPLDNILGKDRMFQNAGFNINGNAQFKNLWWAGINISGGPGSNDFYEPRVKGRVFENTGRVGAGGWWESNSAKKMSWGGNVYFGKRGVFTNKTAQLGFFGKIRFSSKFSVGLSVNSDNSTNQAGFAFINSGGNEIIFSRRDATSFSNSMTVKYNFTNRMGLSINSRHNWTRVTPKQFYQLNLDGKLDPTTITKVVDQNYNYFTVDMVYTWQFAQGSFINIVWKKIGEDFRFGEEARVNRDKNYFQNLGNITSGNQLNSSDFNSVSLGVIYFIDYLTAKKSISKRKK